MSIPGITEDDLKDGISYPRGIDQIPYASYLNIKKYEYKDGLAKVAANQNDALGAFQRSAVMKNMVNGVTNLTAGVYGGGDSNIGSSTPFGTGGDADKMMEYQYKRTKAGGGDGWGISKMWGGTGNTLEKMGGNKEITLPNGNKTTWAKLRQDKGTLMERRKKGLASSEVNLALPEEFQYSYSAEWGNTFKLGTMALMADNAAKFAALTAAGAGAGAAYTAATDALQKATMVNGVTKKLTGKGVVGDYAGNMAKGAQMATNPFGVNDAMSPTNIAGLGGMAPNENAIQMFTKVNFRHFEVSFLLAARNATESENIQTIIEWFKRGMHPGTKNGKGSAVMLTFPDVFVLTPQFVPIDEEGVKDPIQHPMMPKTKLCALTNLQVNTTPMGQLTTVFDGSIPLVTIKLRFSETTALTRADFEGSRTRVNNRFDKGFVKSSLADNHPDIGY
tara:strand:- start:661 stop:2001 length:1341 start_codon:yes stop_codon:yes gene_type:complete